MPIDGEEHAPHWSARSVLCRAHASELDVPTRKSALADGYAAAPEYREDSMARRAKRTRLSPGLGGKTSAMRANAPDLARHREPHRRTPRHGSASRWPASSIKSANVFGPSVLGRLVGASLNWGRTLVPEVADAGEHHRDAGGVGGGNDFGVAARAAGLDRRGGAGGDRRFEPVGERVESVRGDHRAMGRRLG